MGKDKKKEEVEAEVVPEEAEGGPQFDSDKFLAELEEAKARLTAIETKIVVEEEVKPVVALVPLEKEQFPPSWGKDHGWTTIIPRKTGNDVILNGFKVPLVRGQRCRVPKNVLPLAVAGGYI